MANDDAKARLSQPSEGVKALAEEASVFLATNAHQSLPREVCINSLIRRLADELERLSSVTQRSP